MNWNNVQRQRPGNYEFARKFTDCVNAQRAAERGRRGEALPDRYELTEKKGGTQMTWIIAGLIIVGTWCLIAIVFYFNLRANVEIQVPKPTFLRHSKPDSSHRPPNQRHKPLNPTKAWDGIEGVSKERHGADLPKFLGG